MQIIRVQFWPTLSIAYVVRGSGVANGEEQSALEDTFLSRRPFPIRALPGVGGKQIHQWDPYNWHGGWSGWTLAWLLVELTPELTVLMAVVLPCTLLVGEMYIQVQGFCHVVYRNLAPLLNSRSMQVFQVGSSNWTLLWKSPLWQTQAYRKGESKVIWNKSFLSVHFLWLVVLMKFLSTFQK